MELWQVKSKIIKAKKFLPVLLGAAAGFLYYNFVGCITGHCAITSNPISSTVLGAFFGAAFIKSSKKETVDNKNITEKE